MNDQELKSAAREIRLPEVSKQRILKNVGEKRKKTIPLWRKPAIAAAALLLCVLAAVPTVAARSETIQELMALVSPSVAQYFRPVQRSDEDNGIRMEVVSAYIHGDTAEIYLTMQDLTGDRIDDTMDLYDSYRLFPSFDSSAHCEQVGYDRATKTATFLVTVSDMNGEAVAGDKLTFSVREFLSHKTVYDKAPVPIEAGELPAAKDVLLVDVTGGSSAGENTVLCPGTPMENFPVEGIELTAAAYVEDALHLQVAIRDRLQNDNHGYFYWMDGAGNTIQPESTLYFNDPAGDEALTYIEYIFPPLPEDIAAYRLYGYFVTSEGTTAGDWQVTFPLEQGE